MGKEKFKTLFIWIGNDNVTITRGENVKGVSMKQCVFKHLGLFGRKFKANIDDFYVSESKKRGGDHKIIDGWEVRIVNWDYINGCPHIPESNAEIIARMESLKNELDIMTRKYHYAKELNMDREQKDRFKERIKDDFDFVREIKNKLYSYSDAYGGTFGSRWGYPSAGLTSTGNE